MKLFNSKDFFDQLNSETIKPLITISGFVKKSDDKTELYFSHQNDGINWIKIPSLMIDSRSLQRSMASLSPDFIAVIVA